MVAREHDFVAHAHAMFLDGLYAPDRDGKGFMFHPAPAPTQADVEAIVERASKRILRFLQRHGVITLVTARRATGAAKPRGAGAGRAGPSPVGAPRRWNWLHWPSLRVWRPWWAICREAPKRA